MKLPDCLVIKDVKSAFTFWDPIILKGVMACQRGGEIKKQLIKENTLHRRQVDFENIMYATSK